MSAYGSEQSLEKKCELLLNILHFAVYDMIHLF